MEKHWHVVGGGGYMRELRRTQLVHHRSFKQKQAIHANNLWTATSKTQHSTQHISSFAKSRPSACNDFSFFWCDLQKSKFLNTYTNVPKKIYPLNVSEESIQPTNTKSRTTETRQRQATTLARHISLAFHFLYYPRYMCELQSKPRTEVLQPMTLGTTSLLRTMSDTRIMIKGTRMAFDKNRLRDLRVTNKTHHLRREIKDVI